MFKAENVHFMRILSSFFMRLFVSYSFLWDLVSLRQITTKKGLQSPPGVFVNRAFDVRGLNSDVCVQISSVELFKALTQFTDSFPVSFCAAVAANPKCAHSRARTCTVW